MRVIVYVQNLYERKLNSKLGYDKQHSEVRFDDEENVLSFSNDT
jgi:hypothetical protein